MGGERVEVVLDARGDEEDRDEDPEAGRSSLRRKSGCVIARSWSTSERIAPAMNAPRMTSSPSLTASATSPTSRTKAPRTRICAVVSCRRREDGGRAHRALGARDDQGDEHRDHEQTGQEDDLGRRRAGLAREEERQQDHGGEVGDRAAGDDELPERRAALAGVLEDGHEHPQRRGGQDDRDEQRLRGEAAGLQEEPDDDRDRQRGDEPEQREAQHLAPQPVEVDLQAGEEEQVGQADVEKTWTGSSTSHPAEHRGAHHDAGDDLEHDRRDRARRARSRAPAARRTRPRRRSAGS